MILHNCVSLFLMIILMFFRYTRMVPVVGLTVITRHRYELHPQHVAKNDFCDTHQGNKVTLLISIINYLLNLTINVPTYKTV